MKRSLLLGVAAAVLLEAAALGAAPAAGRAPAPTYERSIESSKSAMMSDPAAALVWSDRAAKLAGEAAPGERERRTAESLWLKAEALSRLNRLDEAKPVVAKALTLIERAAPGAKLHGDLLMTRAAIAGMGGDIQTALRDLIKAHEIFSAGGEARSQALALHDLGSIYAEAGDHHRALRYYRDSVEAYSGDPGLTIPLYNNLGTAYRETGRPANAIAEFQKALKLARAEKADVLEVRILTNLASAQLEAKRFAAADATVEAGLRLTAASDSEGWRPFLWGVKAQIAEAQGRYGEAAGFLARTFEGVEVTATPMPFREFHEAAYRVYAGLGNSAEALRHFEAYERLDDEAQSVMSSTNAALMGARFDFAHQELRITKLEAERLKRDVELARSRERLNRWVVWSLAGALAVAALVAVGAALSLISIRRSRNQVRHANGELSAANSELQKALTAKTRFLATTSHEIRTPLNGILGMTQVMLHDRTLPKDQRDRVRIVHEAGTTMRALVDDILDVAKLETGKITIEQEAVDLPALVEEVGRLWTSQASLKGLALSVDASGAPARIVADGRRLRQILFNLMSNAVKFTEKGSVTLSVFAEGGELVVRVADTGIGIPADQLGEIFKSFHQVDGAVTRRYGGTGLGLSICRDLVEAMGGAIEVESELGSGSAFTARVPLRIAADEPADPDGEWPAALDGVALLVVDDNPLTRNVLQASLGKRVAAVVGTPGRGAAQAVAERRFHHVVANAAAFDSPAELRAWLASPGIASGAWRTAVTLLCEGDPEAVLAELGEPERVQALRRPITAPEIAAAVERLHARCADLSDPSAAEPVVATARAAG